MICSPLPERSALFVNPSNPNAHVYVPETRAAADALGLRLEVLTASVEGDLEMPSGPWSNDGSMRSS
jgi:hypothetical protein